jgi:feruloyl esterase
MFRASAGLLFLLFLCRLLVYFSIFIGAQLRLQGRTQLKVSSFLFQYLFSVQDRRKFVMGRLRMQCVLFVVLLGAVVFEPAPSHAATCESLSTLALPDTTITLAQSVPAGAPLNLPPDAVPAHPPTAEASPNLKDLPAFCRVAATLKPTSDSEIKVEIWMPSKDWNGRFVGVGNGSWAGSIIYGALAQALRKGFAAASTDTGHTSKNQADASFALGHPEKVIDFGYRSVHLMTVEAKAVIAAFYGAGPGFSYWDGCSTGGKQGLMEAQRFPDDYNGIVEGDPANFWTHLMFGIMWPIVAMDKDPASNIPPSKFPIIHQAVLKACDALDGVEDGVISDPARCHFDPKVLECKGADGPECLTASQVETARRIYSGARNPHTGEQVFPGLVPGSEIAWHTSFPVDYFKYVLFKDPDWKLQSLNFDSDVTLADRLDGSILNAVDPNLKPFKAHGGKLIMYHGWSDPIISPLNSVNYYETVVAAMGGVEKTENFARLFMIPGMEHCSRGSGPDTFDKLDPIEKWVEHGVAPDRIIASHLTNGVVDMTRPLCPYPEVARWSGKGSTSDAANFACVSNEQ